MQRFSVAEAKAHLSDILDAVSEGEEVELTKRGTPIARIIPVEGPGDILGAGKDDPNIDVAVIADDWWRRPLAEDEAKPWYE